MFYEKDTEPTISRFVIVYWENNQCHEIIFDTRFAFQYDIYKRVNVEIDDLLVYPEVTSIWLEVYEGKDCRDTLKFKVNGQVQDLTTKMAG